MDKEDLDLKWNTHSTVQENCVLSIYSIFLHYGIVEKHINEVNCMNDFLFLIIWIQVILPYLFILWNDLKWLWLYVLSPFCNKSFLKQRSFIIVVIINWGLWDYNESCRFLSFLRTAKNRVTVHKKSTNQASWIFSTSFALNSLNLTNPLACIHEPSFHLQQNPIIQFYTRSSHLIRYSTEVSTKAFLSKVDSL